MRTAPCAHAVRRGLGAVVIAATAALLQGCFRDWSGVGCEIDTCVLERDGGGPTNFRHPGVLVSRGQLDFVKNKIAAGEQPWTAAYELARRSNFASASYVPHQHAVVDCVGSDAAACNDERNDAIAAYTQALLGFLGGDASYTVRAIAIMDAWSATLTAHTGDAAPLQIGWAAAVFARAAEIVAHTYAPGWPNRARFARMLGELDLPTIVNGHYGGGDWHLLMIEAAMAIAVFTDDHAVFDKTLGMWRASIPAYLYLRSDGALPRRPTIGEYDDNQLRHLWSDTPNFVDGMAQTTCDSFGSVALGMAALLDGAETARIQGVDLYREQATRITSAMELHTKYLNGAAVPSTLCGGTVNLVGGSSTLTYEIGYNAYAHRLGSSLPETERWVLAHRPTGAGLSLVWESLTHAETGAVGLE